jgi:hypothetical protein
MIVVSDTSPISALFLVEQLDLLPALFKKVVVPQKVMEELRLLEVDFGHNLSVLKNASWLEVVTVQNTVHVNLLRTFLGEGESEAIALVKEINADYLLIDEMEGREAALAEGIQVIGLLGVLIKAKNAGLITFLRPIMEDLRVKANFYIHESLYHQVLRQVRGCLNFRIRVFVPLGES